MQTTRYTYTEFSSNNRIYNVAIGSSSGDLYYLGVGNDGTYDYATMLRENINGTQNWKMGYQDITPVIKSLAIDPTESYVFFADDHNSYYVLIQVHAANGSSYNFAQFSTILSIQPYYKIFFDSQGSYVYITGVDTNNDNYL